MSGILDHWPTQEEQQRCIRSVAEEPDPAVFFAVHQPFKLQRNVVGGGEGSTQIVGEEQFFKEFLVDDPPEGRIIAPIIGASGVGKTHLIRWLELLLRQQNDPSQDIIVVARSSGLRRVLATLLERLDGPEFEKISERLQTAREHLGEHADAQQLATNVVIALEEKSRSVSEQPGKISTEDELIQAYGHPDVLPAIINDPQLRPHFIGDEDKPGVFRRLAEHVIKNDVLVAEQELHQFVEDDLKLDPDAVGEAAKKTQSAYRLLISEQGGIGEAIPILNSVLDDAKRRLLEMGGPSLVEIFIEMRRAIYKTDPNQELILLIEDFAVMSGLQGTILEMVVHESTRAGVRELCTMRTALAFTEGYHLADTVLTRANVQWKIDERMGQEDQRLEHINELVGAYLNAARVGEGNIVQAANQADFSNANWIPVFQAQNLEEAEADLLELFGKTKRGYPLFPLSRNCIKRLAQAVITKKQIIPLKNNKLKIGPVKRKTSETTVL